MAASMTWHRRDLVLAGRLFPSMGRCVSCGADLVHRMVNKNREAYYFCSRSVCKHARTPVPRSSDLYSGPGG